MKLEAIIRGSINDFGRKLVTLLPHSNGKRKLATCKTGQLTPQLETMIKRIWIGRCLEKFFDAKVHRVIVGGAIVVVCD